MNTLQKLMEKQTYKSHTTRQLILHLLVRLKNTERLDFIPVKGGYHNNNHHFQLTLNSKAQKGKNSVLSENENN